MHFPLSGFSSLFEKKKSIPTNHCLFCVSLWVNKTDGVDRGMCARATLSTATLT